MQLWCLCRLHDVAASGTGQSLGGVFAPEAPGGREHNWLEIIPGKGFFVALPMYGPQQTWIDKTWRPSEITTAESTDMPMP